MKKKLVFSIKYLVFCILASLISYQIQNAIYKIPTVSAQAPAIDIAALYDVVDEEAVEGDILMFSDTGIVRANLSYSNKIFGVLQETPLLVYREAGNDGLPVARSGVVEVNVTNEGGVIKPGDYITSSSTKPGKGQKATVSGYVLGIALDELSDPEGRIKIAMRIEYAELTNTRSILRLFDLFNVAVSQSANDPQGAAQLIKYAAAAFIIIAALLVSFLVFARSISKSVEAMGRNPLAKNAIQLSILINAGLTIITILVGIGAAFIILQL